MRILGIDPGSVVVGWGCLEAVEHGADPAARGRPIAQRARNVVAARRGLAVRFAAGGVLRLGRRGAPLADRLLVLARGLAELFERLAPEELAVEQAFYGKSVSSAMRIGEARGVILAEARRCGLPVHQFAPARVKRVVTGHGSASKQAVAAMTCQLLGLAPVPTERDTTDALAVALCRAEERRTELALGEAPRDRDAVRRCFFRGRKV
jgi:crossover junction endodeoxyribonuclease RuvC